MDWCVIHNMSAWSCKHLHKVTPELWDALFDALEEFQRVQAEE